MALSTLNLSLAIYEIQLFSAINIQHTGCRQLLFLAQVHYDRQNYYIMTKRMKPLVVWEI